MILLQSPFQQVQAISHAVKKENKKVTDKPYIGKCLQQKVENVTAQALALPSLRHLDHIPDLHYQSATLAPHLQSAGPLKPQTLNDSLPYRSSFLHSTFRHLAMPVSLYLNLPVLDLSLLLLPVELSCLLSLFPRWSGPMSG